MTDSVACVGQSAKYKQVRAFDDKVKEGYNLFLQEEWVFAELDFFTMVGYVVCD